MMKPKKTPWNKGLTKLSDARIAAAKKLTPEAEKLRRKRISATAKERGTVGGYRENAGRTQKHYVLNSFGDTVCLQSTHELKVAEWLNSKNIKWKREGCFFYGKKRYFPDFFLPDLNVYLDVKNEYLIKIDEDKINAVRLENPNLDLYVFTLKSIDEVLQPVIQKSTWSTE